MIADKVSSIYFSPYLRVKAVKIAKKREIPLDYTIAAEKLSTGKSQKPKPPMHRAEAADEAADEPRSSKP
ncbi:MAG: hypothetical protein J5921_04025 [Clostridia bacterium]|nr:hypothetical protein [Clostridia bacterium]